MEHIERIIHLLQQSELTQEEYNQIIQPTVNYLVGRIKEELEQAYAANNYKKVSELASILDKINECVEVKVKHLTSLQIKQMASKLNDKNHILKAISIANV